MNQLVFVYGTLKKGFYFHEAYLGENKGIFRGQGHTSRDYSLYVDALPHLVNEESDAGVKGELYEVSPEILARLDELEGHPIFYRRESIEIIVDGEENSTRAWAYLRPNHFQGKQYAHKENEYT